MGTRAGRVGARILRWPFRHLRATMLAGLLLMVPVVITYLVFRLLFDAIDPVIQPGIKSVVGREVRGLGVVILALLVYLVGLLGANFIGRRVVRFGQGTLQRMPLMGTIYTASRQLIESFTGTGSTGFKRVVLIEYPRPGAWTIGFLTSVTTYQDGEAMAVVYIPTAPTPQTGWVAILPLKDVYDTDMSVQTALRMTLSGGIMAPPEIRRFKQDEKPSP